MGGGDWRPAGPPALARRWGRERDQEVRCDALARRIAELAPNGAWAVPGMACRDPVPVVVGGPKRPTTVTILWRLADQEEQENVWCTYGRGTQGLFRTTIDRQEPRLLRALAAGPDWRDSATLNALLGARGEVHRDGCRWTASLGTLPWSVDYWRAGAILAAKVAAMEAANSRDGERNG